MNITEIKRDMVANGSNWWAKETLLLCGTKVINKVYKGGGGTFFVTSDFTGWERGGGYTIREYNPKLLRINSVGSIGEYNSLQDAQGRAKTLAKR